MPTLPHTQCGAFSMYLDLVRGFMLTGLTVLLWTPTLIGAEWPQFRGPTGQGHATVQNLPATWKENENVAWRTEIPGRGWSSPVISGDQIWLTTAYETEASEEERARRLQNTKNKDPLVVSGPINLRAICVNRRTGEIDQNVELLVKDAPQPIHKMNSYASPTAILADGRLLCSFGAYGFICIDTETGSVLWRNTELEINHENGPGSTPVLWGDRVVQHYDGSDTQFIAALDANTGKVVWRQDRSGKLREDPQLKKSYGTPLVVETHGRPTLVSPASDWVYGYDPESGRELWKVPYGELGFSTVPRPVAGNGYVYLCTGFMKSQLIALRLADDPEQTPTIAWRYDKQVPHISSPLLVGAHLYIVSDGGIATCLDAKTGEPAWRKRLGGNFAASPLHADGKVYFCNRSGETFVFQAGGSNELLHTNSLDGAILASPAALDQALYVRTDRALYRIEKQ